MLFNILSIFKKPLHGYSMVLILFLIGGCQSKRNVSDQTKQDFPLGKSMVKYAVGFNLLDFESYKVLHLFQYSGDATDTLSYVLYNQGAQIDDQFSGLEKIKIPQQNIALLHSSYISFFDLCQSIDHIKAISEARYIYNESVYNAAKTHELSEVGYGETLDKEKLLELGVTSVITVGFPNAPNKSQEMLSELEIPVLVFSEWQESTLLGRAEWIKVVAALTGTDTLATSKFHQMESEYNRLKSLIPNDILNPKVVCNLPYKGSWYVPGGNSYVSNVIKDAGGDYLWSDDDGTGGLQLDFEAVYAKGLEADFWTNPGFSHEAKDIIATDERLKDFLPVTNGKVFNNINRVSRGMANDYWESGITHPQIILADMIKIFHSELLPEHELYYYKQLR